jgi:hypothetical protein
VREKNIVRSLEITVEAVLVFSRTKKLRNMVASLNLELGEFCGRSYALLGCMCIHFNPRALEWIGMKAMFSCPEFGGAKSL